MKKLLLPLLLLLIACTGTSEPPLDLLLATGDGNAVVFYPAGTDDAAPVGSWNLGMEVVDLLRLEGESRLWVLTPDRLLAYPLSGGTLSSPPAQSAPGTTLEPTEDCSNGKLVGGATHLLLDCGNGHVWTIALANPVLTPVETVDDDEGTIYLLGPDDQLTKIAPQLDGFELRYPDPDGELTYDISTAEGVDRLTAKWTDEELMIAVDSGYDVKIYTWTAASSDPPKTAGDPLPITGLTTILAVNDDWIVAGEGGYVLRRKNEEDFRRTTPVQTGVVTPNLYAYLAADGKLTVLDLLDPALAEHPRSFPARPRGLVWLPVGE